MDDALRGFQEAATAADAQLALDAVAAEGHSDLPLADMYDELATEAADEGDFRVAVSAQRKALERGCHHRTIAEEMLGWYLYEAGDTREAAAYFAQLRATRGPDLHLDLTEALAMDSSGHETEALAAFDGVLAAAAEAGDQQVIDQARAERRELRAALGIAPDHHDRLSPRPLPHSERVAFAIAWFPRDEHQLALDRWPDLAGRPCRRRRLLPIHRASLAQRSGRQGLKPSDRANPSRPHRRIRSGSRPRSSERKRARPAGRRNLPRR